MEPIEKIRAPHDILVVGDNAFFMPVTIGPEAARQMLSKMVRNRTVKQKRVDQYAREMTEGRWTINGDTIKLDADDRLIDGQHRLLAIIKSGRPVLAVLAVGVDNLDDRCQRTPGDQLAIERGLKDTRSLAAAAHYHMRMQSGQSIEPKHGTNYSHREVVAHIDRHPELIVFMRRANRIRQIGFSKSMTAAIWYICDSIDHELAEDFFGKIITGVGIELGDVEGLFRERMIQDMRSLTKTPAEVKAALLIKAWNTRRKGVNRRVLVWKRSKRIDKKGAESFPVIM